MTYKKDESCSILVVIPTMGSPALILPAVQRVVETAGDRSVRLVVVMNASDEAVDVVPVVHAQLDAIVSTSDSVVMDWVELPGPAGWTGAVNAGIRHAINGPGLPEFVVVMNDDLLVTGGWLDGMVEAMEPDRVHMKSELETYGKTYLDGDGSPAESYGTIGMVGPVSGNVAGGQAIKTPGAKVAPGGLFELDPTSELDEFASQYKDQNHGVIMSADFLSGFCTMYRRDCLVELLIDAPAGPILCDPVYEVGGYDDNDICVRAQMSGWRLAIALDTYVHHLGHRTLDHMFPEQQRGLANVGKYLSKWAEYTQREQKLVAAYRVRWDTPWDLTMLRASVVRVAQLVDGIALLATGTPYAVTQSPEFSATQLPVLEAKLVRGTAPDHEGQIAETIEAYLNAVLEEAGTPIPVSVKYRDPEENEWNERDERNEAAELAEGLDADWILSVDLDEVPEDRLTRQYIEKLMTHPDPMVSCWDLGWLNHWDTPRLTRIDPPWTNGLLSSMRGFRMWRVNKKNPRRITAGTEKGLHCGNCPDFSGEVKRVAAFRMRHFGYIRHTDRVRKYHRYRDWLDPDPDMVLTGGGYDHILNEEGMQIAPYIARNGIMFTMLFHGGESLWDLHRHLDKVYGLADRIVLVWTDEGEVPEHIRKVTDLYGAEWLCSPMAEGESLAQCRNAALDHVQDTDQGMIRWVLTMDPDEHFERLFGDMVSIRRMAEVTDSWGFMFQFRNHRQDGTFNMSETVRMFMLDPGRIMRFHGRVHEKLEHSMKILQSKNVEPRVRYAPFIVNHAGLGKDDAKMQDKLNRYTGLLVGAIKDNPHDCGHWTALGLQYGNEGMEVEMEKCLEVARDNAHTAYLPHKVSAQLAMRKARRYYETVVRNLASIHPFYEQATMILAWLNENAPEMPLSGSARTGNPQPPDVDLEELIECATSPAKV
jgi:GT2 family glycosyltransferase